MFWSSGRIVYKPLIFIIAVFAVTVNCRWVSVSIRTFHRGRQERKEASVDPQSLLGKEQMFVTFQINNIIFPTHLLSNGHKEMAASRLENVTQTIARILEGYDIRLRPNFGGNQSESAIRKSFLTYVWHYCWQQWQHSTIHRDKR